ncbi:unnamed protein product [Hymenolepis diminuta]|uniref:F-box domain-containing protein n=1 Tax=Hymenolepis diminuta TaxID=6216 RepID=A0A0R3SL90_HYMDI|nr:unnamed protein product [Hymenolepis diminuta]
MPKLVLVKIFEYLSWRDRAHAALTCKRWLNSFCAPDVWRSFTYHPPAQGLTRLQYDLKTYFLGRGIRIIGWHFQYLRFPVTEDYFMLNRVLSLIAEFFEAHPNPHNFSSNSVVSTEILFPELAALEANLSPSSSDTSVESSSDEEDELAKSTAATSTEMEIPWDILTEAVDGDPELEKTVKLAMKLQRKEYERGTSSSSSLNSSSASEATVLLGDQ